ncbi:MAG: hypothetical protein WCK83_11115 [Burkholderiales bacterium]
MNRCFSSYTRCALVALALGATLASSAAWAQVTGRPIPDKAQAATLVVTNAPEVLLNGQPDRLSPGARIRGSNNLLVLSASLTGKTLQVRYLREPQGQIHEVWILGDIPPPSKSP